MAQRPDLDLLGIDLAPRMVELAREAVPTAQFSVHDCRHLGDLKRYFDGIICAFGLPYLSPEEATAFIRAAHEALDSGGVLYLSAMLGKSEDSGLQRCSTGDQIYVNFHDEDHIIRSLDGSGFSLLKKSRMASPSAASKATTYLIILAKKWIWTRHRAAKGRTAQSMPRGLLKDPEQHPVFGFNNPNPSPDRKQYGYEFWMRVGYEAIRLERFLPSPI
jgi:Methyltransferase domain